MKALNRAGLIMLSFACVMSVPVAGEYRLPQNSVAIEEAFRMRVGTYARLHKQLEATLPQLPTEATPRQIDKDQRALLDLVAQARATAKPGDLFTPDIQQVVRSRLAAVFVGTRGDNIWKYIHDEPHPITPEINKRYPDTIPL